MNLNRIWFRFWNPLGDAAAVIAKWSPPPTCSDEQTLEESLYQFLCSHLPGFRITRQYAHDRLRADIVIENKVAIELKYGLCTKSEYQRLIGQLEDYAQWNIDLILVLAGSTDNDMAQRISDHLERRFNVLFRRARLLRYPMPAA